MYYYTQRSFGQIQRRLLQWWFISQWTISGRRHNKIPLRILMVRCLTVIITCLEIDHFENHQNVLIGRVTIFKVPKEVEAFEAFTLLCIILC